MSKDLPRAIGELFRLEGTRVLATLVRVLGDLDLAEDAMQEAFAAALAQWPAEGMPSNPRAWLVSTGRFKAIDRMRRDARAGSALRELADRLDREPAVEWVSPAVEDDRLRLIFMCCHPALPDEAQVALTLREVCGLTTEEIARSFLVATATMAQRLVRAKGRLREQQVPFEIPSSDELPERMGNALRVTYLVFNEGYYASSGYSLTRPNLSGEAIRLGRVLAELMPHSEVSGLLALMLLNEGRRAARMSAAGDVILRADQDRGRWDQALIREGLELARKALAVEAPGSYALQAGIAAVHAASPSSEATDWDQIVGLYDRLTERSPSPVVELNRAVAVAMRDGPAAGLALVDQLILKGGLDGYGLAHSARADLCLRLGMLEPARKGFERALELATQEPERRFLVKRLAEVADRGCAS